MSRFTRSTRAALAGAALLAGGLVAAATTPSYADDSNNSARGTAPAVVGHACATGVGVTVAVDFTAFDNGVIRLGCAPGAQSNGFNALTAAGFTFTEGSFPGFLCQINDLPAAGLPDCEDNHYWSYSKSTGTDPWRFSHVGGATQHRINIDAVEGWRFVSFDDTDTAPQLDPTDLDQYRSALAKPIIRTTHDPKRVTASDRVKLTVTVKGGFGILGSGSVSVSEVGGDTAQGTTLNGKGQATFRLGKLSAGEHSFRIEYSGDDSVKAGKKTISFKVFK